MRFYLEEESHLPAISMPSSVFTTKHMPKSTLTTHSQTTQNQLVSYAPVPHRDTSELVVTTKQRKILTIEPIMRILEWAVLDLNQ